MTFLVKYCILFSKPSYHTKEVNDLSLYDRLLESYGPDEPILSRDIRYEDCSRPWLSKQIGKLCREGLLARFEPGVYYIPTTTPFGRSLLDPRKVIEKKYIRNGDRVFGYYAGTTLLNQLGLSSQMANTIELYTNEESSKGRLVTVGWQDVYLRRARTTVTAENAAVLSFMEAMNCIEPSGLTAEEKRIVARFIRETDITGKKIARYAPAFPDRTMRNLIESEVAFDAVP